MFDHGYSQESIFHHIQLYILLEKEQKARSCEQSISQSFMNDGYLGIGRAH